MEVSVVQMAPPPDWSTWLLAGQSLLLGKSLI
jgi:hypothetical protein